jgi:hypothetical protein
MSCVFVVQKAAQRCCLSSSLRQQLKEAVVPRSEATKAAMRFERCSLLNNTVTYAAAGVTCDCRKWVRQSLVRDHHDVQHIT